MQSQNREVQVKLDANRDSALEAQRALSQRLAELLAADRQWGRVEVVVFVEDGTIKRIEEATRRTRIVKTH